jgi:hypothetical protein
VAGAEPRTALLPGSLPYKPRVLAESNRRYQDMVVKNIFSGYLPPSTSLDESKVPPERRNEVLRWIKLTTLSYDTESRRWRGYFYNQARGPRKDDDKNVKWEDRVDARLFKEITITDKDDKTVFEAEVVYIDEGQLVLKADGKYYRLRCGEFLYPAIRVPLQSRDLKVLGLAPES